MIAQTHASTPYAESSLPRSRLHQLNLTFATRVAAKAAGSEDLHPDIMRKHAYHIADGASSDCCSVAADIVGDVSFPYHCTLPESIPRLTHDT
jgi:hypothetical protein